MSVLCRRKLHQGELTRRLRGTLRLRSISRPVSTSLYMLAIMAQLPNRSIDFMIFRTLVATISLHTRQIIMCPRQLKQHHKASQTIRPPNPALKHPATISTHQQRQIISGEERPNTPVLLQSNVLIQLFRRAKNTSLSFVPPKNVNPSTVLHSYSKFNVHRHKMFKLRKWALRSMSHGTSPVISTSNTESSANRCLIHTTDLCFSARNHRIRLKLILMFCLRNWKSRWKRPVKMV